MEGTDELTGAKMRKAEWRKRHGRELEITEVELNGSRYSSGGFSMWWKQNRFRNVSTEKREGRKMGQVQESSVNHRDASMLNEPLSVKLCENVKNCGKCTVL
jgi:hypothetical protein